MTELEVRLTPPASVEMKMQVSLANTTWTRLRSSMFMEPLRHTTLKPRSGRKRMSIF